MKSTIKHIGIIAIVVVIGFSFAACGNGSTDTTKFEGKWQAAYLEGWSDYSFTFTGNNFFFNGDRDGTEYDFTLKGVFTFTETSISFLLDNGDSGTRSYTLDGNKLTIEYYDEYLPSGDFIKQ